MVSNTVCQPARGKSFGKTAKWYGKYCTTLIHEKIEQRSVGLLAKFVLNPQQYDLQSNLVEK